jgi:O-methyltransferase involved in polyketide biosynthesis
LASSRDTLADGLTAVGFDPTQQTFFTWLGIVPYLTEQPVFSTLGFIASCREVLTSCSTMAIPRLLAPTKTNTPPARGDPCRARRRRGRAFREPF